MKKIFGKFRFWLVKKLINTTLLLIDKSTIPGMAYMLAIRDWISFVNSDDVDKLAKKYQQKLKGE